MDKVVGERPDYSVINKKMEKQVKNYC